MYGDIKTAKDRLASIFSRMTDEEKEAHVNAGTGRRLTKEESRWKTREWPTIEAVKSDKIPRYSFMRLSFDYFKKS